MSTTPPTKHPALEAVAVEIWTTDSTGRLPQRLVRSLLVNQNTPEGRRQTALMAREAMIAGNICMTYSYR